MSYEKLDIFSADIHFSYEDYFLTKCVLYYIRFINFVG